MKLGLRPDFSIARVMALPPPCTTTGLISTASRKTMSRATLLRLSGSGESMKLPPYLTTKVAPLKRWMYGSASSKVAALAMRFCMWLVSQKRLLTQRRKEAKTQEVGKWGGGDRHRSTYPAGEGAKQIGRA